IPLAVMFCVMCVVPVPVAARHVAGFRAGPDADGGAVLGPRLEPADDRLPGRAVLIGERPGDGRGAGSVRSGG
ncbi:hypothetical protein, partial [Streptomyces spectabilis]|uniref:hypothetical protein n=1 Tax=Streptomyces spectabilis TaxID=68270 RepID=UPI003F4CDADB